MRKFPFSRAIALKRQGKIASLLGLSLARWLISRRQAVDSSDLRWFPLLSTVPAADSTGFLPWLSSIPFLTMGFAFSQSQISLYEYDFLCIVCVGRVPVPVQLVIMRRFQSGSFL